MSDMKKDGRTCLIACLPDAAYPASPHAQPVAVISASPLCVEGRCPNLQGCGGLDWAGLT